MKRKLAEESILPSKRKSLASIHFKGYSKHKENPIAFGLEPFHGDRGDATLCDKDAGFNPQDMSRVGSLLARGLDAGLIGERMLWTVDDNGWIYELRETNRTSLEYHGYPVRYNEAIAEIVFQRYEKWVRSNSCASGATTLEACRERYELK